jgi:hypothetical protein
MFATLLPREAASRSRKATHPLQNRSKGGAATMVRALAPGLAAFGALALGIPSTPQSQTLSPEPVKCQTASIGALAFADLTNPKTQVTIYNLTQQGDPLTQDQIESIAANKISFDQIVVVEAQSIKKYINTIYSTYQNVIYQTQGTSTDSWLKYVTGLAGKPREPVCAEGVEARLSAPPETTGARQ